jgi:hypothetical protein
LSIGKKERKAKYCDKGEQKYLKGKNTRKKTGGDSSSNI